MKHIKAFGGAMAFVIGSATIFPVMFGPAITIVGRSGGDAWKNTIYDFQTLITGGLAVIAASFTVWQMRRSDMESEKLHKQTMRSMLRSDAESNRRHDEAMALAVRSDQLKVERALRPQVSELKLIAELAHQLWDNLGDLDDVLGSTAFSNYVSNILLLFKDLLEIVGRPQFIEGCSLFPGRLNYLILRLTNHTNEGARAAERAIDFLNLPDRRGEEENRFNELWYQSGGRDEVFNAITFCDETLSVIIFTLEEVGKEYKITLVHS